MAKMVTTNEIAVGMRVMVISPPSRHNPRKVFWGAGVVSFTSETAAEVMFDNGSGGMFPSDHMHCEPLTWHEVACHLREMGWSVELLPIGNGLPPYLWRSPDGLSGSGYRSQHADSPPEEVMSHAVCRGDIHFTELGF